MKNNEELDPAAMLDYVLAYSPVILAVFAAQLVASTSPLRYWLAVCAIPDDIPDDAEEAKPPQKQWWQILATRKAAVVVVYGVVLYLVLYHTYRAMRREFPEMDAILSAILFPLAILLIQLSTVQ
ncbi:hypothetical protein BD410DRAFT_781694 [Rickenella mellea]|uniref:Uncharacterized protein n=1 Tax=Rickenella mellea TaxID=50990 RepID=A0A4Y7QLS9_9AGAM|nr:hypothetical protein BD410DRAFT_781694 [Rickenella mellea]